MVMIEVGNPELVKQTLSKAYDAMRYIVHSMTDEEEYVYKALLEQLEQSQLPTMIYAVLQADQVLAADGFTELAMAEQFIANRKEYRRSRNMPEMQYYIQKTIIS